MCHQLNGTVLGETTVTLEPGERKSISVEGGTDDRPGTYAQRLATLADEVTGDVLVEGTAVAVSDLTAPETVTRGDALVVNATVTNVGASDRSETVAYQFAGANRNTTTVELSAGASEVVTFTVSTGGFDLGEFEHGIVTNDSSTTATLVINGDRTASDYAIDGEYPAQSVLDAIAGWRSDEIRPDIMFEVISRWRAE